MALRIASFFLFFITILSAYGGRVHPDLFPYFSWLTLALPYFAMATALVSTCWLLTGKFFTGGIGAITLVLAWAPISTVFPMHFSSKPKDNNPTFTLLSWNALHSWDQQQNINSREDISKQKGNPTFDYIINSGADIVNLQEMFGPDPEETPNTQEFEERLRKVYPYMGSNNQVEFQVFSKYPVSEVQRSPTFLHYRVHTPWGKLNLINVHLPSNTLSGTEREVMSQLLSIKKSEEAVTELKDSIKDKLNKSFSNRSIYAEELTEYIKSVQGPLIVAGDFNDVPESWAYRTIRSTGLKDAYIDTSFGHLITYNQHGFYFHLDQILYRPDPLRALDVSKGRIKSSDHYPLMATFEWQLPQSP